MSHYDDSDTRRKLEKTVLYLSDNIEKFEDSPYTLAIFANLLANRNPEALLKKVISKLKAHVKKNNEEYFLEMDRRTFY